MTKLPAGSLRDTEHLAARYSATSQWQRERGVSLLDLVDRSSHQTVLDLGCGTGELSVELARRVGPSGRVVAVDASAARLDQARKNAPPDLNNLRFEQASGYDIRMVEERSIDLVYSNYALHWMVKLSDVFGEVHRVLRPGGRLVTEFLGAPIEVVVELIFMMPGGKDAMKGENVFLEETEWRQLITAHDFEVLDFEWPRFTLRYESLPSLFDWLEATSQGFFDTGKLGPEDRAALEQRFPGAVSCPCQGLRMVLRRPA